MNFLPKIRPTAATSQTILPPAVTVWSHSFRPWIQNWI